MPLLEILKDKYQSESRDYTLDLMAHRHFELVLAEAYECKILSNPWLAASIAATHADEPANTAHDTAKNHGSADESSIQTKELAASSKQDSVATTAEDTDEKMAAVPIEKAVSTSVVGQSQPLEMEGPSDSTTEGAVKLPDGEVEARQELRQTTVTSDDLDVASSLMSMVGAHNTSVVKDQINADVSGEQKKVESTAIDALEDTMKDTTEDTSAAQEQTTDSEAKRQDTNNKEVGGNGSGNGNKGSTSDATFGSALREKFVEGARAIRRKHGITCIKEPGEDPQLDYLVNEVMLTYQRLKVRLLKASNQEAQFRLDLETKVGQGIWNQYELSETPQGRPESEFVVYQSGSPVPRQSPQHRARGPWGGRGSAGGRQGRGREGYGGNSLGAEGIRRRMEQEQTLDSYRVESSAGATDDDGDDGEYRPHSVGRSGAGSFSLSGVDGKRTASGKFEKNQVLPLTEWLLKHSANPYPTMDDKAELAAKSGLSTQQVQNWFINMRKRHWTPMMNGKRRPRTFLDYVILSSQQGGDGSSGGSTPVGRGLRGKGGRFAGGSEDSPMSDGFHDYGTKGSPLGSHSEGRLQQQMHEIRQFHAAQQLQQHQREDQLRATRSSSRLSTKPSLDFHDDDDDAFNDEAW